ncbi:thermonuclease family protein [Desulfovibrio sp. OttesenSCG-928-F20]|nr:thermonuclease family protein [Desulfovibrio sp. OttesenSCG-928-F20]
MYRRRHYAWSLFGQIVGKRRAKRLVIALLLAALGLGGGFFLRGKVIAVQDGDSLVILNSSFERERVRLYGVDCPEAKQSGGEDATAFTRSLALFQEVQLKVITHDQYKRAVALVTLPDGRSLNEELVRAGQAWVYDQYCDRPQCLAWRLLEKKARVDKRGLWAEQKPIPPWRWRHSSARNK